MQPKLSIVIPVYNEEQSVSILFTELLDVLDDKDTPSEIIFVDDSSTDESASTLKKLIHGDSRFRYVRLKKNSKKSGALALGFYLARGDIIVSIDADLQDDPREIPKLISQINEADRDVVVGWKHRRKDLFFSKLLPSLCINWLANKISGLHLHDMNSGLKAYRREALENIQVTATTYRFLPHLLSHQGYSVGEIPVEHRIRKFGKTKFGFLHRLRGVMDLITILFITRYRDHPMHLFGFIGMGLLALGSIVGMYLTFLWSQGTGIGNRPLLIFALLTIVVGVQLFSMGLIGELVVFLFHRKLHIPYDEKNAAQSGTVSEKRDPSHQYPSPKVI